MSCSKFNFLVCFSFWGVGIVVKGAYGGRGGGQRARKWQDGGGR